MDDDYTTCLMQEGDYTAGWDARMNRLPLTHFDNPTPHTLIGYRDADLRIKCPDMYAREYEPNERETRQ